MTENELTEMTEALCTAKGEVSKVRNGLPHLVNSIYELESLIHSASLRNTTVIDTELNASVEKTRREEWSEVQANLVKTCKHILCLFPNYQCETSISQHIYGPFFSPNKSPLLRNYIGLEKD